MSLSNKLCSFAKPFLPWRLPIAARRLRAVYRRALCSATWPIDPASATPPPRWPGWPNQKQFALVLTHDVEDVKGFARVEKLMNVDVERGFRSCFNFVPEGTYTVDDSVQALLRRSGCEVGVHGLCRDGKLYNSRTEFACKAARLNEYFSRWGATGFCSPFMQHRLSWLHALNLKYDASTFDTDPIEPEADGTGTIFPFWVPDGNADGYVELPSTLVQDFTLFVLLRERDTGIWKSKVDWVAKHGGMVLLNSHPDYMCFEGECARNEYPVSYYVDFLNYVRSNYEGLYWAALPERVAQYYLDVVPPAARSSHKNICMLAYTHYETDNRVRRYAESLVSRGDRVQVIALAGGCFTRKVEQISGVTIHRVQHRERNERGKWTYAFRLARFVLTSSVELTRLHKQRRFDIVHVHNMPDFLVFAAWYAKLFGARLVLDIHDLVPELFASKFRSGEKGIYARVLERVEKLSMKYADHVIVSNHLWHDTLIARSVPRDKCSVFVNSVDTKLFWRRPKTRTDGRFVILFPGSFQWHQGLDVAVRGFALLRAASPYCELQLYGAGDQLESLKTLVRELGLDQNVKICTPIPLADIPGVIANADLGIVPKRADSFGNNAYSTKIMEFMSQGVPVVASRTRIDTFYFAEHLVHFFPSGDHRAMANAMLEVIGSAELRDNLIRNGLQYVKTHSWDHTQPDYYGLIDSLGSRQRDTDRMRKAVSLKVSNRAGNLSAPRHL